MPDIQEYCLRLSEAAPKRTSIISVSSGVKNAGTQLSLPFMFVVLLYLLMNSPSLS